MYIMYWFRVCCAQLPACWLADKMCLQACNGCRRCWNTSQTPLTRQHTTSKLDQNRWQCVVINWLLDHPGQNTDISNKRHQMRFTCCNSRGAFNKKLLASFLEAGKKSPLNFADFFLLASPKIVKQNLFAKKTPKEKHQNITLQHLQLPHLNHVEAMEDGKMTVEQHEERKGTPSFPAWSVPRIWQNSNLIFGGSYEKPWKHNEGTWTLSAA